MPFKSEKQRRLLWLKHPDIAKRWAHEYQQKKKLPMYVNEQEPETVNKNAAALNKIIAKYTKAADSRQEYVDIEHTDKPTFAGQNPVESILKEETDDEGNANTSTVAHTPGEGENPLMSKLAAIIAPKLLQQLEDEKARISAQNPQKVPFNSGLKSYPITPSNIPPPMGMSAAPAPMAAQAPPQAQQQQSPQNTAQNNGQLPSVGGGASPNANPINSFGALSTSGDINGNAALGTRNMAGAKMAGFFDFLNSVKSAPKPAGPAFQFGVKIAASTPVIPTPPLSQLIDNIKTTPDLNAADQDGFAANFKNPAASNALWAAAGLSPLALALTGYAVSQAYTHRSHAKAPTPKKKVGTLAEKKADLNDVLFNIRRQLPGIHTPDIVAGSLGGAALGGLYNAIRGHDRKATSGEKWQTALKRVLGGAAIGGFGANLVGDRVRRHITNTLLPFGYSPDRVHDIKPESLKQLWRSAILDKPAYRADTQVDLSARTFEELNARRELMRRAFGVHTNNAKTDVWQYNPTGYYSLNEKRPDYEHYLRAIMGPFKARAYNEIDDGFGRPTLGIGYHNLLTDPDTTLAAANDSKYVPALNEAASRPKDRQLDYSDAVDMFGAMQISGNTQIPHWTGPGGERYIHALDRFDLSLSKGENGHLRNYAKNMFNSEWKRAPVTATLDYTPTRSVTNAAAAKSLLGRFVYDKILSQETPWVGQKAVVYPTQQAAAVPSNTLPNTLQFLKADGTPAMPAISTKSDLFDWAKQKEQIPGLDSDNLPITSEQWSG